MLENRVLYNIGAVAGHSMNCQTTAPADQEDGAPLQRKRKAEGGDEAYGEKHPEGPAREGSCRVSSAVSGIPKGGSVRVVGDRVRAVAGQVRAASHRFQAADECFRAARVEVRVAQKHLRAEKRYGVSVTLLCIIEQSYCC